MAGPRYTIAQTRARVAALEVCIEYLTEKQPLGPIEWAQWEDVKLKLRNEILRLKAKAQEVRRGQ